MGATLIIGIDGDETRLAMARRMGADVVLDLSRGGRGRRGQAADRRRRRRRHRSARHPGHFRGRPALPAARRSTLSLGVYAGKLQIPYDAFAAGLGDHRIVTTLCPGGRERMRRLMEVVHRGRVDLEPLLTHRFSLDDIGAAYELFGNRREGVFKVAIRPSHQASRSVLRGLAGCLHACRRYECSSH